MEIFDNKIFKITPEDRKRVQTRVDVDYRLYEEIIPDRLRCLPDDMFDQGIGPFAESLYENILYNYLGLSLEKDNWDLAEEAYEILNKNASTEVFIDEFLKDPNNPIDPNFELDKVILSTLEKELPESTTVDDIKSMFSKDFLNLVSCWTIPFFDENFFRNLYNHRQKLSKDSVRKIFEAGGLYTVGSAEPSHIWSVESLISYFTKHMKAENRSEDQFSLFGYGSEGPSLELLYIIDPIIYIPPEEIVSDMESYKEASAWYEKEDFIDDEKVLHEIIPEIIKNKPIPNGVFPEDVLLKLKRYFIEFSDNPDPEDSIMYCKVFLYLSYHGVYGGQIPGIKAGGYSVETLEKELDEIFKYASRIE